MNTGLFILQAIILLSLVLFSFYLGKYYLLAMIAVCAVLANVFVVKQMTILGLAATGGNVMYAAIFFGTDIINEFYGKKEAKRAVIIGFLAAFTFLIMSQMILLYTPNSYDFAQSSYEILFSLTPRIVIGSLIAYLISQSLDINIYSALKTRTGGRFLWLRNNGSTLISQLVDSVIFNLIAFWSVLPGQILMEIIIFTYLLKLVIALLDTPFLYLAKTIKRQIP